MFTLTEIQAAKPPNSPIGDGQYWSDTLKAAESVVKTICRRALESTTYTDKGLTLEVLNDDGTRSNVWYIKEPKGSAFTYAQFTTIKMDDSTVAEADVTIEPRRLVFEGAGEVELTYAGGYMADTTAAKLILRQAVIAVMHLLHAAMQGGTAPDYSAVRQMLGDYTASYAPTYAELPE